MRNRNVVVGIQRAESWAWVGEAATWAAWIGAVLGIAARTLA